jgi:hypothetical protein
MTSKDEPRDYITADELNADGTDVYSTGQIGIPYGWGGPAN